MSMANTIISALKALGDTVASPPNSVIREQEIKLKDDQLPLVIWTIDDEQDTGPVFEGSINRMYSFTMTSYFARNMLLEGVQKDQAKAHRDLVRKAIMPDWSSVSTVLSGVPAVWHIAVVDLPSEDAGAFRIGYQSARLGIGCLTNEAAH